MSKVPKCLVEDVSGLALGAGDLHLLSFVDGWLSAQDLAFITGKSLDAVEADLTRLEGAGHIAFVEPGASKPPPAADEADGRSAGGSGPDARAQGPNRSSSRPKSGRPVAPSARPSKGVPGSSAGPEVVELSEEDRQAIDELHARLHVTTDEEVLGVGADASTLDVRKAYNKLARRFHPDRHFRKKLGPYKQRIEEIFGRLTAAHDNLRATRRAQGSTATVPPVASASGAAPGSTGTASQPRAQSDASVLLGPPLEAPASPVQVSATPPSPSPASKVPSSPAQVSAAPASPSPASRVPLSTGQAAAAPPTRAPAWATARAPAVRPQPSAPAARPSEGGAAPTGPLGAASPPAQASARPSGPGSTLVSRQGPVAPAQRRAPIVFAAQAEEPARIGPSAVDAPPSARPAQSSETPAGAARGPASGAAPAAPAAHGDAEAARRARADALARRLGIRDPSRNGMVVQRAGGVMRERLGTPSPQAAPMAAPPARPAAQAPVPAPAPPAAAGAPPEAAGPSGRDAVAPPGPYPAVPGAPQSAAEAFRERFGAIEARARERRCHTHVAEAIAALSRGDYAAAAEAYRLASELAPSDTVLARKAAEVVKLAQRRRR